MVFGRFCSQVVLNLEPLNQHNRFSLPWKVASSTPPSQSGVLERVDLMATKLRSKGEPAPIGEKLLTLREAAGVLRMNPRTLRAYLRRGEIEGRVIGGKYRFRRIDLDRFYEDAPRSWDFGGKDSNGV
jgi:excisionase family DNA binding protein